MTLSTCFLLINPSQTTRMRHLLIRCLPRTVPDTFLFAGAHNFCKCFSGAQVCHGLCWGVWSDLVLKFFMGPEQGFGMRSEKSDMALRSCPYFSQILFIFHQKLPYTSSYLTVISTQLDRLHIFIYIISPWRTLSFRGRKIQSRHVIWQYQNQVP